MKKYLFFNDTSTTEIYTPYPTRRSSDLDRPFERNPRALEGSRVADGQQRRLGHPGVRGVGVVSQRLVVSGKGARQEARSEEHTSELQSQSNLVCRLLLEKKKKK